MCVTCRPVAGNEGPKVDPSPLDTWQQMEAQVRVDNDRDPAETSSLAHQLFWFCIMVAVHTEAWSKQGRNPVEPRPECDPLLHPVRCCRSWPAARSTSASRTTPSPR